MRGHEGRLRILGGDILRQFQMNRSRPLLLSNAERLAHDRRDRRRRLTICRDIFVSGFIDATTSTIWNRAWLAVMIAFWPVSMTIGIAPR